MNILNIKTIMKKDSAAAFNFCMTEIMIERMHFNYASHYTLVQLLKYKKSILETLHKINNKEYESDDIIRLMDLTSKMLGALSTIPFSKSQTQVEDLRRFLNFSNYLDEVSFEL